MSKEVLPGVYYSPDKGGVGEKGEYGADIEGRLSELEEKLEEVKTTKGEEVRVGSFSNYSVVYPVKKSTWNFPETKKEEEELNNKAASFWEGNVSEVVVLHFNPFKFIGEIARFFEISKEGIRIKNVNSLEDLNLIRIIYYRLGESFKGTIEKIAEGVLDAIKRVSGTHLPYSPTDEEVIKGILELGVEIENNLEEFREVFKESGVENYRERLKETLELIKGLVICYLRDERSIPLTQAPLPSLEG